MKRFKEIPKDFLAPEYSLQELLNSHIPKHLDGEELGRYIANVMGDQNPVCDFWINFESRKSIFFVQNLIFE